MNLSFSEPPPISVPNPVTIESIASNADSVIDPEDRLTWLQQDVQNLIVQMSLMRDAADVSDNADANYAAAINCLDTVFGQLHHAYVYYGLAAGKLKRNDDATYSHQ